ncbi:MAG: hypothetical protein NC338_01570 [Firmicutes bacterium]|nr:hypothetical protein [Bacillota bacterium]MCM1401080.1 hypothetical protein [Bacteroides sp.]MCM1476999.1 hypothetical protein [Bacteroides sp.]
MEERNIIAIEIGSSKVKGALGTYNPSSGILTVKAVEEEPLLDWVRYGVVSNVEETSRLVGRVIRKIENGISPGKVQTVNVSLGGRSCCSMPVDVEYRLPEEREITDDILLELRKKVESTPLPDRDLYAVVPREYKIDKSVVVRPKGTVGKHIVFSANLITCRPSTYRNLEILFKNKLQLEIDQKHVRQLALGDTVLSNEERELGCMLVDFGAETTTVSIYKNGYLQYMATLPLGSRNITRDIMALNILYDKAEDLKRREGHASGSANTAVQHVNGVDVSVINKSVGLRATEIIANIKEQIKLAGFKVSDIHAGIIIVGRGAQLAGFIDRLAEKTSLKIRIGNIYDPKIRFSDSRISPSDAADVISLLYRAAIHGAVECLKTEVTDLSEEEVEPEPEPVVQTDIPPIEVEATDTTKKRGFRARWQTWTEKLGNMLVEPDEIDEEDSVKLTDDPD